MIQLYSESSSRLWRASGLSSSDSASPASWTPIGSWMLGSQCFCQLCQARTHVRVRRLRIALRCLLKRLILTRLPLGQLRRREYRRTCLLYDHVEILGVPYEIHGGRVY